MSGYGAITIDCRCCRLPQRQRDRDGEIPTICDTCFAHQGQLPDKRIARAEEHEAMLRQRLDACRASEDRAQTWVTQAKQRIASALNSRGFLAVRIVEAAERSGTHRCPATQVGSDPKVIELAEAHRRHEELDPW